MIDLDRTMFFKARFEIEAPQGEDVLWSLVLSVRDWSLRKARRDGYSLPQEMRFWSKLKSGEMLESPDGSVRLYAALHHGEFVQTWACQHVEDQRAPGCAPRRWITEVGFEGHSVDRGTVSIITMFSDMPGYIGPLQPVPKPNVPKLIASMLENDRLVCTIDGCEFGLAPVEFLCSDAPGIHERLANPYREVPAIVISPTRAGECLIDPEVLASQLGPNATVYYTVDCGAMDALNAEFEDESLRCYGEPFACTPLTRTLAFWGMASTIGSFPLRISVGKGRSTTWPSCAVRSPRTCSRETPRSASRTSIGSIAMPERSLRSSAALSRFRIWRSTRSKRCSMRPRASRASPRTSAMPCARN